MSEIDRAAPLAVEAAKRFGEDYANQVLLPRLAHIYGRPERELAAFSMVLPGLTRVVIDDHDDWLCNIQEAGYRAIVGIPDQHRLPAELRHGRRSYYVRHQGSRGLVDAVAKRLQAQGVAFYIGANITKLETQSSTIEWIDTGGAAQRIKYDGLVLTTGAIGAAALLGISLSEKGFDAPISHHLLHFRLAQTNNSSLCYLYSLDPDYDWYRITNYRAFSGDPNDCRLTVEVLGRPLPDEEHAQSILAGLARIGFLTSKHAELIDALTLPSGFPTPTIRNLQAMSQLGKEVRAQIPSNILFGGIGAQPSQFFQNEVVYDIYSRVEGFVEALNG